MRALGVFLCCAFSAISGWVCADEYKQLYQSAGWSQQQLHFSAALTVAQQRYRDTLPSLLYQALVDNSNRRFEATALEQRALQRLRQQLPNPSPALRFFEGRTGRAVVLRELQATAPQNLAKYADGLPKMTASGARLKLILRLAKTLPFSEAGTEVSLALAGVAADSLSQMLPGFGGGLSGASVLQKQKEVVTQRLDDGLINTLLFVYRDLSDAQLAEFAAFSESAEGRIYYRAALQALRASLQASP